MKTGRIAGYDMRGLSRADWMAAKIITGGIGIIAAIAALATVRSWGMRIPPWLISVPMWVGPGLLAPFIVLIPAAAVFAAAADQSAPTGRTFAAHATGTFLTCMAGGLISLATLFLLVERRAAAAAEHTAAPDAHPLVSAARAEDVCMYGRVRPALGPELVP